MQLKYIAWQLTDKNNLAFQVSRSSSNVQVPKLLPQKKTKLNNNNIYKPQSHIQVDIGFVR